MHQDKHTKTYNDRYSKPQQKHRLGTVSKKYWGWGWEEVGWGRGVNRFYLATTLGLSSAVVYTRHLFIKPIFRHTSIFKRGSVCKKSNRESQNKIYKVFKFP